MTFSLGLFAVVAAGANVISFTEETDVIRNPGQGWSVPSEAAFVKYDGYLNIGDFYQRYSWAELEPRAGEINRKPIENLLAAAAKHGLPGSTRVICADSGCERPLTPAWVWERGAKHYDWEACSRITGVIFTNSVPVFADPIFIKLHGAFIKALAEIYDGDPRLAGLDMGSYGNWGEWHCAFLPPQVPTSLTPELRELVRTRKIGYQELKKLQKRGKEQDISIADKKAYLDMYLSSFRKTHLVAMSDGASTLAYAIGEEPGSRVGLRRDGVGGPWHQKNWIGSERFAAVTKMGEVWKSKPIWFEFIQNCNWILEKGGEALLADAFDFMLSNHVSLVNCFPCNPEQIKDHPVYAKYLRQVNLYAGARLVPVKAEVSRTGDRLSISLSGVNKGVARIYLDYVLTLTARDAAGKEVFCRDLVTDPTKWLPGSFVLSETLEFGGASLPPGVKLFLRVRDRNDKLADFRFAAKELSEADGSLVLGAL